MTVARAIDYRIAQNLLRGRLSNPEKRRGYAERLIAILAVAGGLLLFGSLIPELVLAALAGSLVWALAGH
jgi:hypothetical protein